VAQELYSCTTISLFRSIAAFLSRLWASESHPTSKLTFGKPRSRKRRKPRLFFLCPNTLSGSIIRLTERAYPSSLRSFSILDIHRRTRNGWLSPKGQNRPWETALIRPFFYASRLLFDVRNRVSAERVKSSVPEYTISAPARDKRSACPMPTAYIPAALMA
jgi:hypothetical protein